MISGKLQIGILEVTSNVKSEKYTMVAPFLVTEENYKLAL